MVASSSKLGTPTDRSCFRMYIHLKIVGPGCPLIIVECTSMSTVYVHPNLYTVYSRSVDTPKEGQSHEAIALHRDLLLASSCLSVGASIAASAIHDAFAPDRPNIRSADFTCRKSWQRVLQSPKGHSGSAMQAMGWMPRGPFVR